ncbi:MAG: MerR family transcriptional regulator [Anaerolineae bacterium]
MSEIMLKTATEVATELNISPSTLRRWSTEFGPYLSKNVNQSSSSSSTKGHRRYNDDDMAVLGKVKEMLADGLTYREVSKRLADTVGGERKPESITVLPSEEQGVVSGLPLVALRELLHSFSEGQEAILSSQQANRNLLGVVIQDNFNLKEENTRLRERMLRLEQELAELRRNNWDHRASLEERVRSLERKGWLSRLLGL